MQASILLPQASLRLPSQLHPRQQAPCTCRSPPSCSGRPFAQGSVNQQPEVLVTLRRSVISCAKARGRKKKEEEEEADSWDSALDHLPVEPIDGGAESRQLQDEDDEDFDLDGSEEAGNDMGDDDDGEGDAEEPGDDPDGQASAPSTRATKKKRDYILSLNMRLKSSGYQVEKYDQYLLETDEQQRRLRGQKIPRVEWQKMADEARRKKEVLDAEERARQAKSMVVKGELSDAACACACTHARMLLWAKGHMRRRTMARHDKSSAEAASGNACVLLLCSKLAKSLAWDGMRLLCHICPTRQAAHTLPRLMQHAVLCPRALCSARGGCAQPRCVPVVCA